MTDIWNLSAICRCCHLDGSFKSLEVPYSYQNAMEVYSVIIQETFGIEIPKPPKHQSYSICDVCINKLRDAASFKLQITTCEQKFKEYLLNEEALKPRDIKVEEDFKKDSEQPLTSTSLIVENVETEVEVPVIEIKQEPRDDFDNEDYADFGDYDDLKSKDIKQEITSEFDNSLIKKEISSKVKGKKPLKHKNLKTKSKKQTSSSKKDKKPMEKSCQQCNIEFNTRAELNTHNNAQHKQRGPFSCLDCNHETEQFEEMLEHVKTHGKEKVKCRFCDKDYPVKKTLTEHESAVHIKESVYICDLCNKRFFYRCTLRKHLIWHTGMNKKFFCETCGNGFNDKTNLKIHIDAVHLDIRKFKCPTCEKTFKAKKHLKRHLMIHDGIKNGGKDVVRLKSFTCKICSAKYMDSLSFRQHNMSHRSEITVETKTIYVCKGCPETFDDRGKFKSHVMKHNKEGTLPHICHICGLSFSCKYSLNRHVDNHRGLKPYPCDICQKYFSHKSQVDRHKRNVHDPTKNDKVKCPICKNNVRNLEKHQKIHLVRPFSCGLCHRSYPEKNALNRHMKEFHLGLYKHTCDICNTKYKMASLLEKHNEKCHKDVKRVPVEFDVLPEFPPAGAAVDKINTIC